MSNKNDIVRRMELMDVPPGSYDEETLYDAIDEIKRLRASLKEERELRLNAETRAMARIAKIDIRDAHIRYLKSAITNKEEQ